MKKLSIILLMVVLSAAHAMAQNGYISGKVIDKSTGEAMIGAGVKVEGIPAGAITDFDGNYSIEIKPGTYTLVFSYISYANKKVTNITVKAGETTLQNVTLSEDAETLDEIVVVRKVQRNSEITVLNLQKKAVNVQDGISVEEIKRLGASNTAQSVKQITGATVEDGKYIVMRGLGDRYSISQLNGITLPSVDPYRNSSSLDLIPSSMVDNVVVKKTFTPDQPGNFTGGNLNVTTKSIPDKYYFDVSVRGTYNTVSSFNQDFQVDPNSGKYAALGFDDGSRALPEFYQDADNRADVVPSLTYRALNVANAQDVETFNNASRAFNTSFASQTQPSLLDHSLSIAMGDRFKLNKDASQEKFGYNIGFRYARGYNNKADLIFNKWDRNITSSVLDPGLATEGSAYASNANLGGLASLSFRPNLNTEMTLTYLYSHDYNSVVRQLEGTRPEAVSSNNHIYRAEGIKTTIRDLHNLQLRSRHKFYLGKKETNLEWTGGYTDGKQDVPDYRSLVYLIDNNAYQLKKTELGNPYHFFRNLNDKQYNFNADWKIPITEKKGNNIKIGGLVNYKTRDFDEYRFEYADNETDPTSDRFLGFTEADGDFNSFFDLNNAGVLGVSESDPTMNELGYTYVSQSSLRNFYEGSEMVGAGYAMTTLEITKKWKLIGGARVEYTNIEVETEDPSQTPGQIESVNVLPSLGLIYGINDKSNLRLNGSKTLARPNMREIAPYQARDPETGIDYAGNADLEMTDIYNGDIRYEIYPKAGELIALSGFYKQFENPIVFQIFSQSSGQLIKYSNSSTAKLFGAEFEFRKNLDFIAESLKNFKFLFNFTYIHSRVDLSEQEYQVNKALDPTIKTYRPFQAQSPYIVNLNLTYSNDSIGLDATLYSNTFGPRLLLNGSSAAPDVYEVRGKEGSKTPIPDLNLIISKTINKKFTANLRVFNILGANYYTFQEYQGQLFTRDYYRIGTSIALGIKYSL